MNDEAKREPDELTLDEFRQSTKNFITLAESVIEQSGKHRASILESMLSAVVSILVQDVGRELAVDSLLRVANKLQRGDGINAHGEGPTLQ